MKASNLGGDLRFSHPDLLQRALGFRLLALRQLGEHVCSLVHPAALLARFRPDLAGGFPEAECAIGDDEPRRRVEPTALQIKQQTAPVMRALAGAIGEADQFLAAFRRRSDQHQDALLFVLEPRLQMDAISPDVDVALGRQIALLPRSVVVKPAVLQSADRGCRQSGSILAKQRRQRFREVASRDPLQVKDRQQRLDRLRTPHVGRQDRRREPDAVGIGGVRLAIAHTRLADSDRTDTGHHLPLRQVTVADDALVAVLSLQIGMLAEKVLDLGLDRLGEKGACPAAQDFCELIGDGSWLNQLDDVIFGHGISLLRWRSGGAKHPHDMPPFRFSPSPTFGDSSSSRVWAVCRDCPAVLVPFRSLRVFAVPRADFSAPSPHLNAFLAVWVRAGVWLWRRTLMQAERLFRTSPRPAPIAAGSVRALQTGGSILREHRAGAQC